MYTRGLAALLLGYAATANALPAAAGLMPERLRHGKVFQDIKTQHEKYDAQLGATSNTTVNWFSQILDHSSPNNSPTFQQRYWYDTTYWTGCDNGPILMYINGESEASGSPTGYMAVLAQQNNALIITIEHRYYGESIPFPLTNRTGLDYLTIQNALGDLDNFMNYIESSFCGTPQTYFVVGGSYSGALATWFRVLYPNRSVASLASSGVVEAIYDFTAFDQTIAAVLQAYNPTCLTAIRAAYDTVEKNYEDPTMRAKYYQMFNTPDYFTLKDFLWMLADSGAMGVQYGYIEDLCGYMVPRGDDVLNFANWTNTHWGTNFGGSCYYSTACLSNSSYSGQWNASGYSWVYQCCSEVAFWQVGYPGSVRSELIDLKYFNEQCEAAFGQGTFANTTAINAQFGGKNPYTDHVFATNGSNDPWAPSTVQASLGPDYPESTASCFGFGCGHCGVLYTPTENDPTVLVEQRKAVSQTMTNWINDAMATKQKQ